MFVESARPATIEQAIERTEREAVDAWATWGLRSWSQLYGGEGGRGGYKKSTLSNEAADRLRLLRSVYLRQTTKLERAR